jgi:hypothetical protein
MSTPLRKQAHFKKKKCKEEWKFASGDTDYRSKSGPCLIFLILGMRGCGRWSGQLPEASSVIHLAPCELLAGIQSGERIRHFETSPSLPS